MTTPTDPATWQDAAAAGRAADTAYTAADATRVAELAAAVERARILAALAGPLAAYDRASEQWRQANAEQNDAPSVRDADRYSDALENAAHAWAAVVRDLVDGNPPAGPTRRATFRSSASALGAPGYPERTGQPVDVLRPLNPTEADMQEVGPMYRVRFPDGVETTAYANELAEAADDVEDLDRCANGCTCTPEQRAAAMADDLVGDLVALVERAGVEAVDLDELVEDAASHIGSNINNGGPDEQVAFLVAQLGAVEATRAIEQATGRALS